MSALATVAFVNVRVWEPAGRIRVLRRVMVPVPAPAADESIVTAQPPAPKFVIKFAMLMTVVGLT